LETSVEKEVREGWKGLKKGVVHLKVGKAGCFVGKRHHGFPQLFQPCSNPFPTLVLNPSKQKMHQQVPVHFKFLNQS
jgi:hypothetical protein